MTIPTHISPFELPTLSEEVIPLQVSVVVPTCNRRDLLMRCLTALLSQDFDPRAYEIIVVDDGDSRNTRRLVESCHKRKRPMLRYLPVHHAHGPAVARNMGWRAATGEIIAFTDDDCIPDRGWLQAGVAALTTGTVGVWGRLNMPLPPVPTDYERDAARLEQAPFVTANCFVRREVLAVIGGFDERFTAPWREDSDLFFSLLERGYQLEHAPEAVVVHPVRPAPWGVSVSQQRKSMFNALLYKKHPTLYRRRIQPTPPWHYYGIVAALLGACGGMLGGQTWLTLSAAALWGVATARFCFQRLRQTSHAFSHVAEMVITSVLIPPLAVFWRLRGALKFRVVFL